MKHKGAHQYKRIRWGKKGTVIFRCMKPNCKHYLTPEFILGQACECYICGSEFVIDRTIARLEKPHCDNCTGAKEKSDNLVEVWDGSYK